MDILDEGFDSANQPALPMGELVDLKPTPAIGFPEGSVRNRAATSAILSGDPDAMTSKYHLMMAEAADGQDVTHQQVMDSLAEQNKTKSMKHVINILGDRSIPLDQKKRLMNFVQTNQFKEDPSVTLQTNSLAADNTGESLRGEAARISTADVMGEMQKEREDRQKLVNGFMATLPDASISTVGDIAASEVMPFGRNVVASRVAASVGEKTGAPVGIGGWIKNFLMPGSTKANLQQKLMSIPPESREAYTKSILAAAKDSAAVFHNENYFAQYSTAISILEAPTHSNAAIWAENVGTILDAFWVGSEIRALGAGTKAAKMATEQASRARRPGSANPGVSDTDFVEKASWELVGDPLNPNQIASGTKRLPYNKSPEDISQRIKLNAPVRQENPATPFSIIEQVNPKAARDMHSAIMAGTDELAKAVTGVSKEQALVNNTFPQVATESGSVLNKVNQDVKDVLTNTGATRYTTDEFNTAVDTVRRDFREATGLEINDTMTTFRVDGDHIAIDAHYSTPGGAFTTAEGAREQAKYALREYGIRDDEIVVMKRQGMDYVPVTGDETQVGDYIVKVKTLHAVDDSEVTKWNPLDVKRNFLDRISQTGTEDHGSAAGWLMDPGSMLHPTLTGSASIADDQAITFENLLLKPIRSLRDDIGSLPRARQRAIEEFMKEANTNALKHDPFDLVARGFSQPEIKALKDWRDIWDGHYYLENFDMVRTLNSQGYQIFDSPSTKLFAKPIPKNQNIGKVYDPAIQDVRHLTTSEMDSLYNLGGSYAALRRPATISGEVVEHMIVRNTPSEYLRKVRDTDTVLNYREGYYTVNYKAPKFIDELSVDAAGREVRRTIAVAGNTADADMFIKSQSAATGNRHVMREDSRGFKKDGDGYWDLNEASGRIAQRVRGKPLTDAVGINSLGTGAHIENPMESAVRAAKSLAGRSVSRPMLETAKRRFVEQYSDMLKPTPYGLREFPANRSEIVDSVSHTSSQVADARTTYGYIKFLEDGYINTADQIFKGGMNILADELGKLHLSKAERATRYVGDIAPSHLAKGTVFQAYIAMSNPIRQWIVQSHQAGRTMAYNPIGWANGGVLERAAGYIGNYSTLMVVNQTVRDFVKFVDDSGMVAGVDRNSLVRGMGLSMADSSSGFKRGLGTVGSLPQTVGFDMGEKVNQIVHLAAVHEKYTRKGINLSDKTQRDLALTEARALSYDLNKAGELTYTQGSFAAILQFLQMPHKAVLQATNRKIPLGAKIRMAGWDLIMFGAPTGLIASIYTAAGEDGGDILPDDPEHRDMFVSGVEAYALNKMFTMMDDSGEKTRIDLSALKPYDMEGWARMYIALMDKGYLGMLAASPAGQVLAVDGTNNSRRNGRIPQAILTLGRFFNVVQEVEPETPTTFGAVLNDVAKITSGWSAASKAMMMMEARKTYDSMGVTVDGNITTPEVYAAFLGFGTMSTKEMYQVSRTISENKKAHEADVMKRYRDIVSYYASSLDADAPDIEHIQKVSSMMMRTFNDPEDLELVNKQWQKDLVGKEAQLFASMVKASGMPTEKGLEDAIRTWPVPQEQKDQMMGRLKAMKAQREFSLKEKE
jgi:hypothetical protein